MFFFDTVYIYLTENYQGNKKIACLIKNIIVKVKEIQWNGHIK